MIRIGSVRFENISRKDYIVLNPCLTFRKYKVFVYFEAYRERLCFRVCIFGGVLPECNGMIPSNNVLISSGTTIEGTLPPSGIVNSLSYPSGESGSGSLSHETNIVITARQANVTRCGIAVGISEFELGLYRKPFRKIHVLFP